jgi:drug/metabolite transporter (DMT)-like permease
MTYRAGLLLLMGSVLLSSMNGLSIRLVDSATSWQAVVYRHLFLAIGTTAVIAWRRRGRVIASYRAMGAAGLLASAGYGFGSIGFVTALAHTTVADTMFVISAMPITTAIVGRLALKEQVRPAAWIAMAGAGIGIAVMAGQGLGGSNAYGFAMALLCVVCMSAFAIGLRWGRSGDMLPTVGLGSLIAVAGAMAISPHGAFDVTLHDLVVLALWGGVLSTAFCALFVFGSRSVPGGEMMLFTLVEAVLSPIWVWLAFGEVPAPDTMAGGVIVMGSVAMFALSGLRRRRPLPVV